MSRAGQWWVPVIIQLRLIGGYRGTVTIWPALRAELLRLQGAQPDVLVSYPNPNDVEDRPPPYTIMLEPSGVAVAEQLHQRFGDEVQLRVGALAYPPASGPDRSIYAARPDASEVATLPEGLTVRLAAPLAVRSGEDARAAVLVTNGSREQMVVNTNGHLLARVVDPATGAHVGGSVGFSRMPLVRFPLPPDGTTEIPLIVGTASLVVDLGYTVPAGEWALTVDLKLADERQVRSQPMPFQVI